MARVSWETVIAEPPGTLWADQGFLLYGLMVAGKNAEAMTARFDSFLAFLGWKEGDERTLLEALYREYRMGTIGLLLKAARTGQYGRLERAVGYWGESGPSLAEPDLTAEDLERIPGCGPKTSRFWLLYRRPGTRVAALDVHALRFLRDCGLDAPKSTPSSKRYAELEKEFLLRADALDLSPTDLDNFVWRHFAWGQDTGYDRFIAVLAEAGLA